MPPKAVSLIGAVFFTTGWLLASMLTPPVARLQVLPERTAVQPPSHADTLAPPAEQLQLRLRHAPQPPTPRRNPFAFGNRQRVANNTPRPDPPSPPAERSAPAVVGPMFSLSGIGVSDTVSGPLRTAVLSDGNTVHLLKAGETIGGYDVIEVNDDSVTLVDGAGSRYVLRLKN